MKPFFILILMAATITALPAQTFGTQQSSDPGNASITYTSATGNFVYTDPTTTGDDNSYVPLTGTFATYISSTRSWNVNLTTNLGAASLTRVGSETPQFGMAIGLISSVGGNTYQASIGLAQNNNTGDTSNTDVPSNAYGTIASFEVDENGSPQTTVPLNGASIYEGTSYRQLTGGTNSVATTESSAAATGILSLSFNSLTDILTGSYDGTALGSISLSSLGANPSLTLGVAGFSGEGVAVTSGLATASAFSVTPEPSTWLLLVAGLGVLSLSRIIKREPSGQI